jgi:hypothetical protein
MNIGQRSAQQASLSESIGESNVEPKGGRTPSLMETLCSSVPAYAMLLEPNEA